MARTLAVVLAEIRTLVEEASDISNPPVDPVPTGTWYIGDPDIFIGNTDFYVGGERTGGGSNPITLTVGAIAPGTEGSGVTGITLTVGAISASNEGNPSQAVTLTVGSITPTAEGTQITLTVGAINPAAEGN